MALNLSSVGDLRAIAQRAMLDAGFSPDFPPNVVAEAASLGVGAPVGSGGPSIRDLRSLLWSSIDNPDSRDLDQVEFAERLPSGDIRILVAIADVDAFVQAGSATDRHAAQNTT
jgi:exoribonuclease-2